MPYVKRGFKPIQGGAKPIDAHSTPFKILRGVRSARDARRVLQLSQSDLGREIGRVLGCAPLAQSTIANVEAKRTRLAREYLDAIGKLLATWMTERTGRFTGVKLTVNSPWRVQPCARCDECGKWFEMRRAKQTRCEECKK